MLLSDEKASHLSHLILDHLKKPANARLQADEPVVLREIKRVLAAELKVEQEVEAAVRRRLAPMPGRSPKAPPSGRPCTARRMMKKCGNGRKCRL